eukprot:7209720-Prymnesium_polylepis.2
MHATGARSCARVWRRGPDPSTRSPRPAVPQERCHTRAPARVARAARVASASSPLRASGGCPANACASCATLVDSCVALCAGADHRSAELRGRRARGHEVRARHGRLCQCCGAWCALLIAIVVRTRCCAHCPAQPDPRQTECCAAARAGVVCGQTGSALGVFALDLQMRARRVTVLRSDVTVAIGFAFHLGERESDRLDRAGEVGRCDALHA